MTLQTGFPLDILAGKDQSNTGHQYDRVNATGQATALARGSQDPQRFFNTSAYSLQPFGFYGNAGRNTLIGPGVINWDFSTIKAVAFCGTPHAGVPLRGVQPAQSPELGLTKRHVREREFRKNHFHLDQHA